MRAILWLLALSSLLPIAAGAFYMANGSLEMFPTDGQDAQARLAGGAVFAFALLLECAIVVWWLHMRRRDGASSAQERL